MSNMRVTHMLYTEEAAPPAGAFIFTAVTTGVGDTFTLPLESSGTYNFNVDWGDTSSDIITVWNQAETTHTYASAGTYVVTITGTITGWRFAYGGSRSKFYEVREWGPLRLGNNTLYFAGCNNLTVIAIDNLDLTGTTTLEYAFWACTSLTTVPSMNTWDVSNVTDMDHMFDYTPLFNQDIGNWDVSNVTTMHGMFYSADSFNQDLNSWNVSSVIDMNAMFYRATAFNGNITSWDVSSVTGMQSMFADTPVFNQNIGSWNVSSVTDMQGIFENAIIFNQDIGSWVVSSVVHMGSMFYGAIVFNQDIGSWNVSSVLDFSDMFYGAIAFNQDIGSWNVSSANGMQGMFNGATLFNQDISGWTTSSLIITEDMFNNATAFDQDLSSWNITLLIDAENMFLGITLSTANYNALLTGWEAQVEQPNVTFHGGNSTYNAGAPATARAALAANGWIITDGGQV